MKSDDDKFWTKCECNSVSKISRYTTSNWKIASLRYLMSGVELSVPLSNITFIIYQCFVLISLKWFFIIFKTVKVLLD